jgi:DNA polymerase III epsilon subunit-like protein
MKFIALDTETGGIDDSTSLLTAFFQVYDDQFQPVESLSLTLRPNDGQYVVSAGGLQVNGINLIDHNAKSITYKEASPLLYAFLDRVTDGGKTKLYAIGVGLEYDLKVLNKYLLSASTLQKYVSVKRLDLLNIALFLKTVGILPPDLSHSLVSLAAHYNIEWKQAAHDAQADALMSVDVFLRMRKDITSLTLLN